MKKFLVKVMVFIGILVLLFIFNFTVNFLIYKQDDISLNEDILFIGDSHIQNAINPEYIDESINIAQQAEPYILSFWKLKKLLNNKKGIVVLGFSPHNIAKYNDFKFEDEKWSSEMFERSYPIQDFYSIQSDIEIDYLGFIKTYFKQNCFYPQFNHRNYIGGYKNSSQNITNDYTSAINRHYFYKDSLARVSELSIQYLDSIISYVSKTNKELILLNTPVHKNYSSRIPETILNRYEILKRDILNRNIKVLDYHDAPYHDTLFLNVDHLNEAGARKFSMKINTILKGD